MKGTAKSKVVSSGRLTGGQLARRRRTPDPGPAARPEPAYSLYSSDSEAQVSSLHKGLDRCAALLSGILQSEKADALPGAPRAAKGGAAKSRQTSCSKKQETATNQRSRQSAQRRSASSARTAAPPTRLQVKLRPSHKQASVLLESRLPPCQTSIPPPQTSIPAPQTSSPPPQTSVLPPAPETSIPPPQTSIHPPHPSPPSGHLHQAKYDGEEVETVPVRDVDTQSWTSNTSTTQPDPGQVCKASEETAKMKTVQYLLGELKALIAGQGSVAERLLSHLEQTVSSPPVDAGGPETQSEADLLSLNTQNSQLRRRVRILNQQLKEREKAARQHNMEVLCSSEAALQEELAVAQCRLQELQDDLTELRKALQDTQEENALIKSDLKTTRSRLMDSEREKAELNSLAQQRLEQIENLNRILQSSSHGAAAVDSVAPDNPDPAEPPADRITQFLMSLDQRDQARDKLSESRGPTNPRLSQCESMLSYWSATSESTFNTRDEAAFRDGLAALDASIASLQKTIQLDLGR